MSATACPYSSGKLSGGFVSLPHPGGLGLTQHAIELSGLAPGSHVLDLGCGSGDSLALLRNRGFIALGLDPATPAVEGQLHGVAESIPLPDASLDGILAECSLSVMDDPGRVLAECARVLRPGGILMLSDLYARNPEAIAAVRSLHGSCVSGVLVTGELHAWLCQSGFQSIHFEDYSRELREATARFILEHDTVDELWAADEATSLEITAALRQVRAGYFLLIAARIPIPGTNGENHG